MSIVKRNETAWSPSILDDMLRTDWFGGRANSSTVGTSIPAVNIRENEDGFHVEVAAPGMSKEDFNIELDNDVLNISTETKNETEQSNENEKYTRKEFSYRSFKRAFSLPDSIDSNKIAASYENGVLEIKLPKKEEAKIQAKRMIEIS